MPDTIQDALKALYCSFGGNADAVRNVDDINALLRAIASLNVGAAVQAAAELPDLPEDDGTYTLQVVIDDGEATFSWEAVSAGV